jgi:hypothetical protein
MDKTIKDLELLLEMIDDPTNDHLLKNYYDTCLSIIGKAFTEFLAKENIMVLIYKYCMEDMKKIIDKSNVYNLFTMPFFGFREIKSIKIVSPNRSVNYFSLIPKDFDITDFDKHDERRLIFQALFLMILRLKIPNKYTTFDELLELYPEFINRNNNEKDKLIIYANWMNLLSYTIKGKHNKLFSIDIITRICEGRDIVYNTGSGETYSTRDRVSIFNRELNVEKSVRPNRISKKRKLKDSY